MIQDAIARVAGGQNLNETQMTEVMEEITDGKATSAQIGAFLLGLRVKGETVDEIVAAAKVMRDKSTEIPIGKSDVCLDRDEINVDQETLENTTGTEGEETRTFNVSSTTAFVVAGAGLRIAKHGYRAVTSRWGSADVLEALGVPVNLTPRQAGECVREVGIGFLYAPQERGFMSHVVGPRREIGVRTIFNQLGPLTNPAGAPVQVLGVYREQHTEIMAEVLGRLGCRSALVVYGEGSHDEFSITGSSKVTTLRNGDISTETWTPEDFGLSRALPQDIAGGNASQNAAITRAVLKGEKGARRDMVLFNAAAVLLASDKAASMKDGLAMAAEAIDSGKASEKMEKLLELGSYMAESSETPAGWGWGSR
jgi:anthranilate phosphoribosyltransferase